jgi:hypothetical protein
LIIFLVEKKRTPELGPQLREIKESLIAIQIQVEKECLEVISRCHPLAGAKNITLDLEIPQDV